MNRDWKDKLSEFLLRYKAPLLVLLLGMMLLLFGSGESKTPVTAAGEDERLAAVLSDTRGVGECRVLLSDNGVVVVCSGAENAAVRLDIIRAVGSYTGFSSDRITILKLAE